MDPRDSAGLFVAPGTSTRCLAAAGKPTALVSADVDIVQQDHMFLRRVRSLPSRLPYPGPMCPVAGATTPCVGLIRRCSQVRLTTGLDVRGGSLRDDAAHRGIRTERPRAASVHRSTPLYVFRSRASSRRVVLIVSSQVSIWVSICVLQENQQPLRASRFSGYGSGARDAEVFDPARAPGPGAGLSVAPEISTRQGFQCLRGNQRAPK
ncbi:hypothetical protein VTO73DRAFT_9969 [Trametes versicolor]